MRRDNSKKRESKLTFATIAVGSLLVIGFLSEQSEAQSAAPRPQFEVASIKPDNSGSDHVSINPSVGGRYTATNVTLKILITMAYKIRDSNVSGGPGWIDSSRFDIEAKANGNPDRDQITLMVQTLLEDRFKLAVRRETKELPVYALSIAKNGPKLKAANCASFSTDKPSPPLPASGQQRPFPCGSFRLSRGEPGRWKLDAAEVSMSQLADFFSNEMDRPVVEKTGVVSKFDVHLEWTPDESTPRLAAFAGGGLKDSANPLAPVDTAGLSIFTAFPEQLGIRLEPAKGPVQVLIIDNVEKPTPN